MKKLNILFLIVSISVCANASATGSKRVPPAEAEVTVIEYVLNWLNLSI